jgi:uncharacterized protein (TIGR03067 family)
MRSTGIVRVVLIIGCSFGTLYRPNCFADDKGSKSTGKLDGKWQVVRQEERGGPVPAEITKNLSMNIDGNKMECYIGNPAPNFAATITIDEEKQTIDAKITRSSFNGKTMLGIYKFEKDQLHMCWGEIGTDKRPEKFATAKPGEGPFNYTVYSRQGGEAKGSTGSGSGSNSGSGSSSAQQTLKAGDVVYAEWMRNAWFHGKIAKVDGEQYHIAFDDGDKIVVASAKIALDRVPKKEEVKVDTRVLAKLSTGINFYPGKVSKIAEDRYEIKYDDGTSDSVKLESLRLISK